MLLRQYLKVGGQFLGFNVDTKFSNALDVLVMADLRMAPSAMLDRCMRRTGAEYFRDYHKQGAAAIH